MKIAVTGGIGGGKSTAARILAHGLNSIYLSSDCVCRDELLPGRQGYKQLVAASGERFIGTSGDLNRSALRHAVFSEPQTKKMLEDILHPLVAEEIARQSSQAQRQGCHLVAEVPLLFEAGLDPGFDRIVVVYCPQAAAASRVAKRDGLDPATIAAIQQAQMPLDLKLARADYVINNGGIFTSTMVQIQRLVRGFYSKITNL